MTKVVYGVWDGVIHDNCRDKANGNVPPPKLQAFDHFNDANPIRAFFADRGFFVFDENVSLIDAFWRYMSKAAEQSCGKCTPCRVGTVLVRDALGAMRRGVSATIGLNQIAILAEQMTASSLCNLGRTCGVALGEALRHFRDRIEAEMAPDHALLAQHGLAYMTSPCIEACPSKINVPRYIDYIRDGKPEHSLGVILQKYPMAGTCGRVCVRFCEMACRRNLVDEAVGIKTLKRYVADQQTGPRALAFTKSMISRELPADMRVAVVGAGPAGVSCAYHLLLHGYHVNILEATAEAGGMAHIGIPSYRLPKDILESETNIIKALGGRYLFNEALGRDYSIDDLFERGYKAVFLGLGCQQGTAMGVEGENTKTQGYETGLSFLLKVHDHVDGSRPMKLSGEVVVVGGGNVAMDCVRSAVRLGASKVHLVYRRTQEDMPADKEEIEAALAEGIEFHVLTNPSRIVSEQGRVTGVELVRMLQTNLDDSGRRKVKPIPGSEYLLPCSTVVAAIGQQVQTGSLAGASGVTLNKWNCVAVDQAMVTSRPGVFAGGDCVSGPSTLIHAMAAGLTAARSIDSWLQHGTVRFFARERMRQLLRDNQLLASDCIEIPVKHEYRVHHPELDPKVRKHMFEEVEGTISTGAAYAEAKRCMRCYRIYSVITGQPIPEGAA